MTDEDVAWLIDEIDESLDVGQVGLYEFIWALRSRHPNAPIETLRPVAQRALERMRETDDIVLIKLVWPSFHVAAWPAWSELDENSWADAGKDPYFAIARPEELDEEPPEWVRNELESRS